MKIIDPVRPIDGRAVANDDLVRTRAFEALACGKRLSIVHLLLEGERSASDLVHATRLTKATVSAHMSKLKVARIVRERRSGRSVLYRLETESLRNVVDQLNRILIRAKL